jgi:hypothetical protein
MSWIIRSNTTPMSILRFGNGESRCDSMKAAMTDVRRPSTGLNRPMPDPQNHPFRLARSTSLRVLRVVGDWFRSRHVSLREKAPATARCGYRGCRDRRRIHHSISSAREPTACASPRALSAPRVHRRQRWNSAFGSSGHMRVVHATAPRPTTPVRMAMPFLNRDSLARKHRLESEKAVKIRRIP